MSKEWSDHIPEPGGTHGGRTAAPPPLLDFYSIPAPPPDDRDELLKYRFLCRGGGMLFVGQTGIGKSAFIIQCSILWSLGREAFGIIPSRPLRILLVQAENDSGDLAEFREGVLHGLGITPEERSRSIFFTACEDSRTSAEFCTQVLKPLLEQSKPDLLIIDPAFAYLGGESNAQKDVSAFLRNNLNPLIHLYRCGVIIIHHSNKPPQGEQKGGWQATDFAYLGSGSTEWANWARAVLVVRSLGSYDTFELRAAKRGKRLCWTESDAPVFTKLIGHSKSGVCWREVSREEHEATLGFSGVNFARRKPTLDEFVAVFPKAFTDDPRSGLLSADQIKNGFVDRGWQKDTYKGLCDEAELAGRIKATSRSRYNQVLRGIPEIVAAFEARQTEKDTIFEDVPLRKTAGKGKRRTNERRSRNL